MGYIYRSQGEIVRDFLVFTDNPELFDDFFQILKKHACATVFGLLKKGWKLPENSDDVNKDVHDTANHLMGLMLGVKNGRQYGFILDYFETHLPQISDPNQIDYFHLLTDFVRRFCPQYLNNLKKEENPQMAKLKRQIDRAISDTNLYCTDSNRFEGKSAAIWRSSNSKNLRTECDVVEYDHLLEIVEEAYYLDGSCHVPGWCANVFEILNCYTEFRNYIFLHQLKSAMVNIRFKIIDQSLIENSCSQSIRNRTLLLSAKNTASKTISYIHKQVIPRFVDKKRLTRLEADQFLKAVESYLDDQTNGCETASIPTYLRETELFTENQVYLKKYKYMFETVIEEAREKFIEIMKKDPTIGQVGDY